jgi:hypothetical protein
MPWMSNLKLLNSSSVLVMFVWWKDQIDLTKLMGLKLRYPEWDLQVSWG